jgi:hypothetical protein
MYHFVTEIVYAGRNNQFMYGEERVEIRTVEQEEDLFACYSFSKDE